MEQIDGWLFGGFAPEVVERRRGDAGVAGQLLHGGNVGPGVEPIAAEGFAVQGALDAAAAAAILAQAPIDCVLAEFTGWLPPYAAGPGAGAADLALASRPRG